MLIIVFSDEVNGTHVFSNSRRAQQAPYFADFTDSNDEIAQKFYSAYDFIAQKTGYKLSLSGQETPNVIQYNVDDEYT